MIYLTQFIYIIPGQEKTFNEFEDIAIPIISRYNGRMLLRVRPDSDSFIENQMEKPYEIHFVVFDTQQDFQNFQQDEERKQFLYLKEKSIKASMLVQGTKL